ncbi:MAG: hypothetical protein H6642_08360 [Caldilineaceae bacterium]|nr:hypothetical protein [Caldilineaceae bacterium]
MSSQIIQLYQEIELFSEGDPPRNTLFVLGKPPLSALASQQNQLLIIDPPLDVAARFVLEGNTAALFTGPSTGAGQGLGVSQVQTQPGGVAHLRIGDHFLDIYSQARHNVVYLPALGILAGGSFGSDSVPPSLAPDSNGDDELESLRLLAGLVKQGVQLYLPRTGTHVHDKLVIMQRLANDVAYLHAMQRIRAEGNAATDELLPAVWRTVAGEAVHEMNVEILQGG